MSPDDFVDALESLSFENAFTLIQIAALWHDLDDAPRRRSQTLRSMLQVAIRLGVDDLWIGQALGYCGGRRTGLAFTDDAHIHAHAERWDVSIARRPTRGEEVAEKSATAVWSVLSQIDASIFLWNVFPLHPHKSDRPFSNRPPNTGEYGAGEELLFHLIDMLRPRRLIAIGNDAEQPARRLADRREVVKVRHPSRGGQTQFRAQMRKLYDLPECRK